MDTFIWIGKTDTPKLGWHIGGPGFEASAEDVKDSFIAERHSMLFRKTLPLTAQVARATVSVCGLGLYQLYLNGKKVGDAVLSPLETMYQKRVLFDEFDVTGMLRQGENVLAAEVGNGKYSPPVKYWDWRGAWYGDPCLTVRLKVRFLDGSEAEFSADGTWKCAHGAIFENCWYDGEHRDGNLEQDGWNDTGFDDSGWDNALVVEAPSENIEKNNFFHIQKLREIHPVRIYEGPEGKMVCDFGENISGWTRIRAKGQPGAKITLRHGERVTQSGCLDAKTNRHAENTDVYILNGKPIQEFEPQFTLHGFSGVEVSIEGQAQILEIAACVVHASLEETGSFLCDNGDFNRLHEVILRTQKAALMSFPMDCPQRDERKGWLGDAHVTTHTCLYNFDMRGFYEKWLEDIRLNRNPETGAVPFIAPWHGTAHALDWSSGYAIILWDYYLFYRDKAILEHHVDALIRYVEFLKTTGPIQEKTRYGDWMSVAEGWNRGDPTSGTTMYYYYNISNLVKILGVLGRKEEEARYAALKETVKEAILERFYDPGAKGFDDNTQFSLSMALMLDLIPETDVPAMVERLVEDVKNHGCHLTTGILGTRYLMEVLRDQGRQDVAMKLLLQDTYPSWLDLIRGRTTLAERWDGTGSGNHCMFGSVDSILYSMLAGIRIGEEIVVEPWYAEELNWVDATVKLPQGSIRVRWERQEGGIRTEVTLSGNLTATFRQGEVCEALTEGTYILKKGDVSNES